MAAAELGGVLTGMVVTRDGWPSRTRWSRSSTSPVPGRPALP